MNKIFVNSLPKSGTNLASKCLELMGCHQSAGIDASLVAGRGLKPSLRRVLYRPLSSSSYLVGIDMPVELSRWAIDAILAKSKQGEFITGHLGYNAQLLKRIKYMGFTPIVIIRNPFAVLNSFVHYVDHSRNHPLHGFYQNKTLEQKYRYSLYGFSDGKLSLRSLPERCKALDVWIADEGVQVFRFEDMVGPSGGGSRERQQQTLEAIASLLGIGNVDITNIAEQVFGPGRHTFRKGSINSWKQEMPAVIRQEAGRYLNDVLSNWTYTVN